MCLVDEDIMDMGERKRQVNETLLADGGKERSADSMGEIAKILQNALHRKFD